MDLSKISVVRAPDAVGVLQCFDGKPICSDPVIIEPGVFAALLPGIVYQRP
jgi:hypothetical protein